MDIRFCQGIVLSEGKVLGKEEFKSALFDAVENLIEHRLSNPGRELIMSYFNDVYGGTSLERAVKAMEKYIHDDFPPVDKRSKKLKASLNRLAHEAELWDRE